MFNADCRSGSGRRERRATNTLPEIPNSKMKAGLRAITKSMFEGISDQQRPNLIELIARLERWAETFDIFNGKASQDECLPLPCRIDPNVLTGHKSIRLHSDRLCVKEYVAAYRSNANHVREIVKGAFKYFVMSRGASPDNPDCKKPVVVNVDDAILLVNMLTLQPCRDDVDNFLVAHRFMVGGHVSFKKWSQLYDPASRHQK